MVLLKKDPNAPPQFTDEMPVANRYSLGMAGERFFRAIKEEARILGTRCPTCRIVYVPPSIFCERCLSELSDWIDVGTVGEVHSFTLLYLNEGETYAEHPVIVAFIKIGDGGLIHKIDEISPSEVTIGMKVEAVFRDQGERSGSILDIQYFRPVSNL